MDLSFLRAFETAIRNAVALLRDRGYDVDLLTAGPEGHHGPEGPKGPKGPEGPVPLVGTLVEHAKKHGKSMAECLGLLFQQCHGGGPGGPRTSWPAVPIFRGPHRASLALWALDRNWDIPKARDRMISTDQIKALGVAMKAYSADVIHMVLCPAKLSFQARKEAGALRAHEFWLFDDLLIDLPRHELVLPHKVISEEALKAYLGPTIRAEDLPVLPKDDPMARWLGLAVGTIVFLDRPDMPSFRVVK
jgi:DNA-directed RNA polymerase subunit H (RpoH/RPB5)